MKIFYVGSFDFPIGDAPAARVLNNAKIFRDLGHKVIFIGMGQHHRAEDRNERGEYYYQGFQYYQTDEIRRTRKNIVKRTLHYILKGSKIISILKKIILLEGIDIIIGFHSNSIFTIRLLNLCKSYNIKLVVDIVEWYSPNELPGGKFGPISLDNEFKMRYLYHRIPNKIVISTFLNKYYGIMSNSLILPPLVDSDDPKWIGYPRGAALIDKADNGIKFIYAGTPAKKDSLDTMLNSIINLLNLGENLFFYIVGLKQADYANSPLYCLLIKYEQYIKFLGWYSQEVIPSLYKQVDFSLLLRENTLKSRAGFPTKLVESMMSGVPIITNITSDIGDYIIDGINGFVIDNSSEISLSKSLRNILLISKDKLQDMKDKSIECGLERFDYRNYMDRTKCFLESLK